jgi:transcriptional regulator with XRE-family HTH domain
VRTFDPVALRRHLEERHLTLAALAAMLGVERPNVSRWVHGMHKPSPRYLAGLARALNVAPHQLTTSDPAAAELYDLRVWTGQSIRALASAAGLPWQSYAAIEAGARPPPEGERLQRLAAALSSKPETVRAAAARTRAHRLAATRRPAARPQEPRTLGRGIPAGGR